MPDPLREALDWVAGGGQVVVDDLTALVGIDTTYPPGENYPTLVGWAEGRLGSLGFGCRRVEVPRALWDVPGAGAEGARVNLVASLPGEDVVGIYAHMDVVPAGAGWSTPPFTLTQEGGYLQGRGAADIKSSIAAIALAMQAVVEHRVPLRYAPRVLLCTDEEGGAYPGVRYLAERGEVPGHLICLDGAAGPRIWTGSFGSLELLLTVEGRAGHSGQRGSGDNALERAVPILGALLGLKGVVEARVSGLRGRDGVGLRPILALTVAHAGTKANIVPGRCTIALNRRYSPEEEDGAVLAEIEAVIAAAAPSGTQWRLQTTGHLAAVAGADRGPHWGRWLGAMADSFGWEVGDARAYGATSSSDMGWVQRARGEGESPEILIGGAIRADSRVHGVDERVAIGDVLALAGALVRYLAG